VEMRLSDEEAMSEQKQKKNRAALGAVITTAIAVAIEGARHFPTGRTIQLG
jgi:VanZ family protein